MKLKICLMGLLCLIFSNTAKPSNPPDGLKVGDKVPDILIGRIINYPAPTARISDFKNKVLLLDFWATWCASCIQNFPKAFALQKKYPESLQVLLVNCKDTKDQERGVQDFLDKRKDLYQFPCVVNDSDLNALFPHRAIPHYAVIKNNTVLAITDAENINEQSIKGFIEDKDLTLPVKKDNRYDPNHPLFTDGTEVSSPIVYRSTLTGRTNLRSTIGYKRVNNGLVAGIYLINQPVLRLYMYAYPLFAYPPTRIIYNLSHPENFSLDSTSNAWKNGHFYTYEALFPPRDKAAALALMGTDLGRYFHLKLDTQYRDTECYVLRLNNQMLPKPVARDVKPATNIDEKGGGAVYYVNSGLADLCSYLEWLYKRPFLDESGYRQNITLDLPANFTTETSLMKCLPQQGFILKKEKRRISFLVLTEETTPK